MKMTNPKPSGFDAVTESVEQFSRMGILFTVESNQWFIKLILPSLVLGINRMGQGLVHRVPG